MIQRGLDREERQVGKLEFYLSQVWYGGGGATTDGRRLTTMGRYPLREEGGGVPQYPAPAKPESWYDRRYNTYHTQPCKQEDQCIMLSS